MLRESTAFMTSALLPRYSLLTPSPDICHTPAVVVLSTQFRYAIPFGSTSHKNVPAPLKTSNRYHPAFFIINGRALASIDSPDGSVTFLPAAVIVMLWNLLLPLVRVTSTALEGAATPPLLPAYRVIDSRKVLTLVALTSTISLAAHCKTPPDCTPSIKMFALAVKLHASAHISTRSAPPWGALGNAVMLAVPVKLIWLAGAFHISELVGWDALVARAKF